MTLPQQLQQRGAGSLLQDEGAQVLAVGHGPHHGVARRSTLGTLAERLEELERVLAVVVAIHLHEAPQRCGAPRRRVARLQRVLERGAQLRAVARRRHGALRDAPLPPRHASEQLRVEIVQRAAQQDRKSTRLNSSHSQISYAVFCLKKKNTRRVSVRRSVSRGAPSGWTSSRCRGRAGSGCVTAESTSWPPSSRQTTPVRSSCTASSL